MPHAKITDNAMKYYLKFLFILLIGLTYSCHRNINNNSEKTAVPQDTGSIQKTDSADSYTILTSLMTDTVTLDRFLDQITHQEKVKIISKLNTSWDEEKKVEIYSDSNYFFQLKNEGYANSPNQNSNAIFIDHDYKVSFKNYNITCYHDTNYLCVDYGFNLENRLIDPKIIEVCGKRFLYADIIYWCNGIGCGCNITFIYDLETHKPTFIENYRIPYSGFYLSDFNNDNSPDLLVISSTLEQKMKGFDFDEFEIRLTPFSYNKGVFKPHFDLQYRRTYCYELYSFAEYYHHSYHNIFTYSITKDNWFR